MNDVHSVRCTPFLAARSLQPKKAPQESTPRKHPKKAPRLWTGCCLGVLSWAVVFCWDRGSPRRTAGVRSMEKPKGPRAKEHRSKVDSSRLSSFARSTSRWSIEFTCTACQAPIWRKPPMGFEPTTCALRKRCSTAELGWQGAGSIHEISIEVEESGVGARKRREAERFRSFGS